MGPITYGENQMSVEKDEWDELFGYLEENPAPPAEDQVEDDCCVEVAEPCGMMK